MTMLSLTPNMRRGEGRVVRMVKSTKDYIQLVIIITFDASVVSARSTISRN